MHRQTIQIFGDFLRFFDIFLSVLRKVIGEEASPEKFATGTYIYIGVQHAVVVVI